MIEFLSICDGHHKMFAAMINGIGYVFATTEDKVDFDQCLCCWHEWHVEIMMAISEHLKGASKVIFCGFHVDEKTDRDIGFDATFYELEPGSEERQQAEAAVLSCYNEPLQVLLA